MSSNFCLAVRKQIGSKEKGNVLLSVWLLLWEWKDPRGSKNENKPIAGKWGARWERNPSKEERAQCGVAVHPAFEKWWWRQRDWVKILLHLPEEKPLWYIRRQVSLTQWFPLKKYVLKTIAPEGSKMIYNWVIMGTNYLDTWWKDIYNIYY